MSYNIKHVSMRELLTGEQRYVMARYQRHYEWGRREMDHLTGDIKAAFEDHLAAPDTNVAHFFNCVIFYPDKDGVLQVVDGQQRLTSLALVLAVAREQVGPGAVASEIDELLTLPALTAGGPLRQRLTLHRGDNDTFGPIVLSGKGLPAADAKSITDRPGADRILSNAVLARNWFVDNKPQERELLVRFIADRCNFVAIEVDSELEAFRIFETVNSRGRPISSEDVLRFALVEYATNDPKKRDELFSRWDELESELGIEGLRRFVSNWRSRASGSIRPRMPLHRAVLDSFESPAAALAFIERELGTDVALFAEIDGADADIADPVAKARIDVLLQSLRLVKFDDWVPIASATLERWRNEPGTIIQVLAELERTCWHFYLNTNAKGIVNERRDELSGALKVLQAKSPSEAVIETLRLDPKRLDKLRNVLGDKVDPRWPPLRSLVVRIEMALTKQNDRIIREELTLEHILPRNASTKAWLAEFNNDEALMDRYAENPGNLCVLPDALNNELGSKTYANKQKIIRRYGAHKKYALAADFHAEPSWNAAVIERRAEWMRATLREIFNL